MATKKFATSAQIENTPQAVIDYVADPRNRPAYFTLLKSISDVKGDPRAVGATWKWTFGILGVDLEGTGRCLKHEPGKLYSFKTEGGIESTFTYKAEPSGKGTKLIIELEYTVPEKHKSILPIDSVAESMKKAEAERAVKNLKTILDQ
jgi:carbon monoxide dehydrogenase subunit G